MFDSASKKLPEADYVSIVKSLYAERAAVLVGAGVTTTAAASTYLHTGAPVLAGFTGAFVITAIVRYMLGGAFDRAEKRGLDAAQAVQWERRLTVATCTLALIYGLWSFVGLVFVEDPFAAYASTSVSIAMMIGLTTRNFAADRMVTIATLLLSLPLAAGLIIKGEIYYAVIGMLMLPFLFTYRKLAADVREIFLAAVRGRMEATRLASELDSALSTMAHGLCMIDRAGRVLVINEQARRMLELGADATTSSAATPASSSSAPMPGASSPRPRPACWSPSSASYDNTKLVIGLADGRPLRGDLVEPQRPHRPDLRGHHRTHPGAGAHHRHGALRQPDPIAQPHASLPNRSRRASANWPPGTSPRR